MTQISPVQVLIPCRYNSATVSKILGLVHITIPVNNGK
jgi:hypothetical protein